MDRFDGAGCGRGERILRGGGRVEIGGNRNGRLPRLLYDAAKCEKTGGWHLPRPRGNKNLPTQSLVYITVANLRKSLKACAAKGGVIVAPERDMGGAKMAVIRDPAGAVAALFQPAEEKPAKKTKTKPGKKSK